MQLLVETPVQCPYCSESFTVLIDTSQGDINMIEDCTVCCRPMEIDVIASPGEVESVSVQRG